MWLIATRLRQPVTRSNQSPGSRPRRQVLRQLACRQKGCGEIGEVIQSFRFPAGFSTDCKVRGKMAWEQKAAILPRVLKPQVR